MSDERNTAFIQYPSQQEALSFLEDVLAGPKGLGLLHGPNVAGKSELIEQIAQKMRERAAVAVVDGSHQRPTQFLNTLMQQFGYELELTSNDELLNMVSVFSVQQVRTREAPVLILEHFNHMLPDTLSVLCKLATLTVHNQFALRIILVGDKFFSRVIDAPNMQAISSRFAGHIGMQPLTCRESQVYLFARLRANGIRNPESAVPVNVCESLHAASGGWPGNLDRMADTIVAQAGEFPIKMEDLDDYESEGLFSTYEKVPEEEVPLLDDFVDTKPPHLIISHGGQVVHEQDIAITRTLIGRSPMCDVFIDNHYISKQHALLVQSEGSLMIVDLKSRNGTFVNSRKVNRQVLCDNDIISLGDFRIKVILPADRNLDAMGAMDVADTTKMMTLEDMRRVRNDLETGKSEKDKKR